MPEPLANPQSWSSLYSFISGLLLALIPYTVREYRDRKKSRLEDEETTARTALARANAQSVALRDSVAIGESVGKMLTDLIEAGDMLKEARDRIFDLEQRNIRYELTKLSLKKAKALLDYHQIPFSEADEPEMRKRIERPGTTSRG